MVKFVFFFDEQALYKRFTKILYKLILGPARALYSLSKVVSWSSHDDWKIVLIKIFIQKICSRNGIEQDEESLSLGTIKDTLDFFYLDCENLLNFVCLHFPPHWRKYHSLSSLELALVFSMWKNLYCLSLHCLVCFHYSFLHGFSYSPQLRHHYFWTSLLGFRR